MLHELTPRQFSEWIASEAVEPWSDTWQPVAELIATIHNEFKILRNMFSSTSLNESDLLDRDACIPRPEFMHREMDPERQQTFEEVGRIIGIRTK